MEERYFTVAEANALLPVLVDMLTRLQALQKRARAKYEEMERIKAVGYRKDGNLILLYDYQQTKKEFDELVAEANHLIGEINATGCQLKDIDRGLVDFAAVLDEEEVLLCWQMGEPSVGYFHKPQEGFSGRRPLKTRDPKE